VVERRAVRIKVAQSRRGKRWGAYKAQPLASSGSVGGVPQSPVVLASEGEATGRWR